MSGRKWGPLIRRDIEAISVVEVVVAFGSQNLWFSFSLIIWKKSSPKSQLLVPISANIPTIFHLDDNSTLEGSLIS